MNPFRTTRMAWIARGLLLLVALAPAVTIGWTNRKQMESGAIVLLLSASALGACVWVAPLLRWKRLGVILLGLLALLAVADIAYILSFGWAPTAGALSLIAETNPAESADLMGSLPSSAWASLLGVAVLMFFAWPKRDEPRLPRRIAGRALLAVLLVLACTGIGILRATDPVDLSLGLIREPWLEQGRSGEDVLLASFPTGLPAVIKGYCDERQRLVHDYAKHRAFRFGVHPAPRGRHRRIHVLVVGESSRSDHWQLNGYARPTNPRLASRRDVIFFRQLYSAPTISRLAVPVLLTRKPPTATSPGFHEASIVTAFKEAGYRTAWFSLQAPFGVHDSPISVLAYEADELDFLNPVDYRSRGVPDTASLRRLRRIVDDPERRDAFVVIHTLGSHFRYTDRYPKSMARFQPDLRPDRAVRLFDREDREYLVNGYDNTILMTDRLLDGVIRELERAPDASTWLMYSSDHGESLYDDCRNLSGHGFDVVENHWVPGVFWASGTYRKEYPDRVARLAGRRTVRLSTAMMFETLSDLGDLGVPVKRPNNSLAGARLRLPLEVTPGQAQAMAACPKS